MNEDSMELLDRLTKDLSRAMKNRDVLRRATLRLALAALSNARVAKRGTIAKQHQNGVRRDVEEILTDEDVLRVLRREVKMREEAIEAFSRGGRKEAAEKEEEECCILKEYLPEEPDEAEIRKKAKDAVRELSVTGSPNIGRIMGKLMRDFGGHVDGSRVRAVVEELLASHEGEI